jgi:hypothetical protein
LTWLRSERQVKGYEVVEFDKNKQKVTVWVQGVMKGKVQPSYIQLRYYLTKYKLENNLVSNKIEDVQELIVTNPYRPGIIIKNYF